MPRCKQAHLPFTRKFCIMGPSGAYSGENHKLYYGHVQSAKQHRPRRGIHCGLAADLLYVQRGSLTPTRDVSHRGKMYCLRPQSKTRKRQCTLRKLLQALTPRLAQPRERARCIAARAMHIAAAMHRPVLTRQIGT
jgi:hypothetical protein